MPKDYQISQYDEPLCVDGYLDVEVDGETHRVGITRVHMEEDTGKSLHVGGATGRIHGATHSLVDYNRAGIPLVEIVTEPDIRSPEVAKAYVAELRELVRALGVSEARMEQGQLRCDANVSLRPRGAEDVRHPHRDQEPQLAAVRGAGGPARDRPAGGGARRRRPHRPGDPALRRGRRAHARPGRTKEEATDYRYFPEPDLAPLALAPDFVEQVRGELPELPGPAPRPAAGASSASRRSTSSRCATRACSTSSRTTIAAGAPPGGAAVVVAQRAGPPRSEPDSSRRAADHAAPTSRGSSRWSPTARSPTRWPGRSSRASSPARATPDEVVAARGLAVVRDDDALGKAVDAAIAAQPDIAEKVRGGKVAAVGPLVGSGDEGDGGQADAKRRPRAAAGEARRELSPAVSLFGGRRRPVRRRRTVRRDRTPR